MSEAARLGFGEEIFDSDGRKLETIRGFDEHGFYVTSEECIQGLSVGHLRSGRELGEAELMWRCWDCGEMGGIADDLPEEYPNRGAPREGLYCHTEDRLAGRLPLVRPV